MSEMLEGRTVYDSNEVLIVDGKEVPIRSNNVAIVQHMGKNAVYDHVIVSGEGGLKARVWRANTSFEYMKDLAQFMGAEPRIKHYFVNPYDIRRYEAEALADLEIVDHIVTGWTADYYRE